MCHCRIVGLRNFTIPHCYNFTMLQSHNPTIISRRGQMGSALKVTLQPASAFTWNDSACVRRIEPGTFIMGENPVVRDQLLRLPPLLLRGFVRQVVWFQTEIRHAARSRPALIGRRHPRRRTRAAYCGILVGIVDFRKKV